MSAAEMPSAQAAAETQANGRIARKVLRQSTPQPTNGRASAHDLAGLDADERRSVLAGLAPEELAALEYEWPFWARADQLPPAGDWRTWLLLGGRGSGKTCSAAEWVRAEIESGRRAQLGVVGPTSDAVRRIQVEGPSGLLSVCPPWARPSYEPSTRRIVWGGAVVHLLSAEEPDRIRGLNIGGFWGDEVCSWANAAETWDMVQMALRVPGANGEAPRGVLSTTPKMMPLLKSIIAAPSTVITRARTSDNAANLDASTIAYLEDKYGGTRLGRQELDAELLQDVDGALWSRDMLDDSRRAAAPRDMRRVVVGVDPAGGTGRGSTETGIIVAGVGREDGHFYVVSDVSGRYTPQQWAKRACDACTLHLADRIVAERNYGGQMVEATIRSVAPRAPITLVNASRGKSIRAEPVVALYEQGKVHHVGNFPALEDQLTGWNPAGNDPSPDRLDALVWALTELMGNRGTGIIRRLGY